MSLILNGGTKYQWLSKIELLSLCWQIQIFSDHSNKQNMKKYGV
jgi:hypothetical protein